MTIDSGGPMRLSGHAALPDGAPAAQRVAEADAGELAGPAAFVERYQAAYRLSYRLLGDTGRATAVVRESIAVADAAAWPRSARLLAVRTCRAAATSALRSAPSGPDDPHDERAILRGALRALPGRMRAVFILIRLAELPAADVADALGLFPAWCDEQLQNAERRVGAAVENGTGSLQGRPAISPGSCRGLPLAAGGKR